MASTVEIVPYQPGWPAEFAAIARPLRQALGELAPRIDHIGSTAVPGLAAKDVIDIQITVSALNDSLAAPFTSLGYVKAEYRRDHATPGFTGPDSEWEKMFFAPAPGCPPAGARSALRIHVHVRVQGRANQRYALLFRDYLRTHPDTAEAYAELKRRSLVVHPKGCSPIPGRPAGLSFRQRPGRGPDLLRRRGLGRWGGLAARTAGCLSC